MADMVTVQELENVKIDVRTAGEAVNENKIVTPRYGVPFKSFPMIAEEMQSVIGTIIGGGVPASIVLDLSGKSQQELNTVQLKKTRSVLDYGATNSLTVASDAAFTAAINDLNNGDLLTIDGDFYLENDWIINKEINIDVRGEIYLNGNNNNAVVFKQNAFAELLASDLNALPKKGDIKLDLKLHSLGNLSEYTITIESTEILIARLGFVDPYYKNIPNIIIANDGTLANPIDFDFNNTTGFKICFFKKQSVRIVNNLVPKIKSGTFTGSSRDALIKCDGVNNIIWNGCGFDKSNALSNGSGFGLLRSMMMIFNKPFNGYSLNSVSGDSYSFIGHISGFIVFNNPYSIIGPAVVTEKSHRIWASRHGTNIEINGGNGIIFDEHWGYRYSVNNAVIASSGSISFAGGDLEISRCQHISNLPLVNLRADTPFAEGDLIVSNCKTRGGIFFANRSSSDSSVSVPRKSFDNIRINGGSHKDNGTRLIAIRGYNKTTYPNDVRYQTSLDLSEFDYVRQADLSTALDYGLLANELLSDASFKVLKKLSISNINPIISDTDANNRYMLRNVEVELACISNSFNMTANELRPDVITSISGSFKSLLNFTPKLKADFVGVLFPSDMTEYYTGVVNTISFIGCQLDTALLLNTSGKINAVASMFANTYGVGISAVQYSVNIDIANYTNPLRVKQLVGSRSLPSDVVINAGLKSTSAIIATVGARTGDAVIVSANVNTSLAFNAWVSSDNNISYEIVNNSASTITVPAGTVIKAKVIKM